MVEMILFILGSMIIIGISLPSLRRPATYRFYRFFAWEMILGLLLLNVRGWFNDPFVWHQLLSWLLLTISIRPACARSLPAASFRKTGWQLRSHHPPGTQRHLPLHPPPSLCFALIPGLGDLLQIAFPPGWLPGGDRQRVPLRHRQGRRSWLPGKIWRGVRHIHEIEQEIHTLHLLIPPQPIPGNLPKPPFNRPASL